MIHLVMPKNYDPQRRLRIIQFISDYLEKHKKGPTIREITDAVELKSLSSTYYHLEQMGFTAKGFWRQNKKELMMKYKCPTCLRPIKN